MSQRSGLLHIPVARLATFSRAFLAVLFCVGLMALPPLLVANLTVWLVCDHPGAPNCAQLLELSTIEMGM